MMRYEIGSYYQDSRKQSSDSVTPVETIREYAMRAELLWFKFYLTIHQVRAIWVSSCRRNSI